MICGQLFKDNIINRNKNLIYLGFEYDGEKVLLKSASLAGFYRKMKKSIRRGIYYSIKHKKEVFKRRLYKKYHSLLKGTDFFGNMFFYFWSHIKISSQIYEKFGTKRRLYTKFFMKNFPMIFNLPFNYVIFHYV